MMDYPGHLLPGPQPRRYRHLQRVQGQRCAHVAGGFHLVIILKDASMTNAAQANPAPRHQVVPHWMLERVFPPAGRALSKATYWYLRKGDVPALRPASQSRPRSRPGEKRQSI